jgi:hypothetical protein
MTGFKDFNDAGEQRSQDVIPAGTFVTVQMNVIAGGVGEGGSLTNAANSACKGLNCEFTVVGGDYDKRKIFKWMVVEGTTLGHAEAAEITRNLLRAILEGARGIRPDDKSEAATAARKVSGWGDFEGLRFICKLGVEPPKDGYAAKNKILEVVTPEKQLWRKVEQIAKPTNSGAQSQAPTTPPANAISRPQWAG